MGGGAGIVTRLHGKFADPRVEARYQDTCRTLRRPFVRIYGVLFMVVALLYSVINPIFMTHAESAHLAILLACMLTLTGSYVALTFWPRYAVQPWFDFAALLGIVLLLGQVNLVLFNEFNALNEKMYAVGGMNRLLVSAFAAVILAGRLRMYLLWLACDLLVFSVTTLPLHGHAIGLSYALLSYLSGAAVMIVVNATVEQASRGAFALSEALDVERARNEDLVHNMLPPAAVERIRDGRLVADAYADASVIFIDMVGFTQLAKRVSPGHLVELLNVFFNHADRCAAQLGVEKVKTVGDAYLAIAGGSLGTSNCADAAIAFARAVLEVVPELQRFAGMDVGLRVGIHSGPVVGGVIGATRMAYDYWGETVNMAARVESTAPVNGIAVTESCWLRATDRTDFGPAMPETLKGVGETTVHRAGPLFPTAASAIGASAINAAA